MAPNANLVVRFNQFICLQGTVGELEQQRMGAAE